MCGPGQPVRLFDGRTPGKIVPARATTNWVGPVFEPTKVEAARTRKYRRTRRTRSRTVVGAGAAAGVAACEFEAFEAECRAAARLVCVCGSVASMASAVVHASLRR